MRVLVCGGRDYDDTFKVWSVLDELKKDNDIIEIIEGGAFGADRLAGNWAYSRQQPVHEYPANWEVYGKPAGMIRNRAMLALNPDLVIAFPGGKGTANMVKIAREANIEVKEIQ